MFLSLWNRFVTTFSRTPRSSRRGRGGPVDRPFRRPLWLEPLEDRLVFATSAFYSMPINLTGNQGTVVSVPVSINHLFDAAGNQGLNAADVVLTYDPTVFSVSSADVTQGSLLTNPPPNGTWTFSQNTATLGEIDISFSSSSLGADVTSQTGGVLANINFHVKGSAATGNSTIHVVAPPETSPNGLSSDATPDSGPNSIQSDDPTGYTLDPTDQVDGVINVTNITPVTTLSAPTTGAGNPGNTITVPVNISNPDPNGSSGMFSADAAILYDPNLLSVAATGAVTAGSVIPASGWTVTYGVDTSGNNTIDATKASLGLHLVNTNSTPLTSTSPGSLWLVTFTINPAAPGETTAVNLVPSAKVGGSTTTTNVTGLNKVYSLIPAPTNAPNDPVDGSITINQAAAITSGNSTTFTTGANGSFTVTTTGSPTPSLSESGPLPTGVNFTDNGNGTATLHGIPAAGTGATYPFTITAHNGIGSDATQNFTLTVNQAPAITSGNSTTFTVGANGSFSVTATGFPTASLSESGPLPTGVSFTDNGNGTATLHGIPAAGTGNTYPITITAHNGVGTDATQSFTLTVDQAAAITSGNSTTFTVGANGSFSVTATGFPTPSLSESGALPTGVGFTDNGNGTATLTGIPAAGMGGTYPITITAHNGVGSDATQSFTLTVNQAAAITSGNSTTFTVGTNGSFSVTATGFPKPSLSESGPLPTGVGFTDNGNGTATLTGMPAAGMGGTYPITITAHNGSGSDATQNFTLTVNEAAAITSGNSTTFTVGTNGSFSVTTTGFPKPSLSESGALPTGVSFTDNGNGTATLHGMPAAGTGGMFPFTITAHNGVGTDATQNFTLTVNQAAAITSGNSTTFTVGANGSFSVTTTGFPKPSLSESGPLPTGVSFTDNGNGTATLHGIPAAGTGNTYPITITAHNGVGSDATQSFTLTVNQAAAITSGNSTTFTVGTNGSFSVTTTGFPKPSLSESGALPTGVSFTDNGNGTATLHGLPAAGTGNTYPITITAHNGIGSDATQSFTLTVNQPAAITSGNSTTFTVGSNGSFSVTATGFPTASLSESGPLPTGVSFTDNGNGTATLHGMLAAGTGNTYPITITAHNSIGSDATQSFTLTVNQSAAITSGNSTTFTVGSNGSFSVTATGFPTASLSESGPLPTGVSFTDNGNGTATLHGIPAAGTGATYPFTITAHNGVGTDATQSFTLTVDQAAAITSGNSTTFTVGANGSFSVTATGFPTPTLSESGPLPTGVSFTDNGNGTATLHGLPAAGTGGSYPFTITAHNGIGSDALQSFTLSVNQAPVINSGNSTTFIGGQGNSFSITTDSSFPTPTLSESGPLPTGVSFTDNGNGTATLHGMPAAGTSATFPFTITAHNGIGSDATQNFTLTVNTVHFAISVPTGVLTGKAFNFTVTALDSSNSTVTGYSGTVHFTSSDGAATLPANAVLTNGVGTFSATLATLGNQTLTATDTVTASISGTSPAIAVTSSSVAKGTFISQVYLDLLQRQPDPQGLAYWTAQLNGGVSQTEMAFGITQSSEYLVDEVQGLYLSLLRREADPIGLAWAVNLLATGTTTEQLKANIIGSPEYFTTQGGGTTDGFLNALYLDVLGRPIDPVGQAWGEAQLQTSSNAMVAYSVLTSQEAQMDLVQSAYQEFLGRKADPQGLAYYTGLLQQGITDQTIYSQLIGSPEYMKTQTNGQLT